MSKLIKRGKTVSLSNRIKITMVLECEAPPPVSIVSRVYRALRGDGDKRQGKNMFADIGWYVKSQIEENTSKSSGDSGVKIKSHSYKVDEVE